MKNDPRVSGLSDEQIDWITDYIAMPLLGVLCLFGIWKLTELIIGLGFWSTLQLVMLFL